jgi:hypothetical protein
MNQSLSLGELLPSRHRRGSPKQQRRRQVQQQQQKGEDLLYGAHQLMQGMQAGPGGRVRV